MEKGVIMGFESKYLIMMTKEGRFCKGKKEKANFELGQEIYFEPYEEVSFLSNIKSAIPKLKPVFVIAALMIFVLSSLPFMGKFNQPQVVAYINMDINPSIEMGINEHQEVIALNAINDDGEVIKESLIDWEGQSLDNVASQILDVSEEKGYLKDDKNVLFTTTILNDDDIESQFDFEEKVESVVNELKDEEEIEAITMVAEKVEYESAKKEGLSVGKYVLYKNSTLSKEEVKSSSINKLVRDMPNVQDIAKEQKDKKFKNSKKYLEKQKEIVPTHTQPIVEPVNDLNEKKDVIPAKTNPKENSKSDMGKQTPSSNKNTQTVPKEQKPKSNNGNNNNANIKKGNSDKRNNDKGNEHKINPSKSKPNGNVKDNNSSSRNKAVKPKSIVKNNEKPQQKPITKTKEKVATHKENTKEKKNPSSDHSKGKKK